MTVDEYRADVHMIGDVAGATMPQREAKNVLAMAPARPLGPIRRGGRAAGGSQSGRRRSKRKDACARHAREEVGRLHVEGA